MHDKIEMFLFFHAYVTNVYVFFLWCPNTYVT
jgi:hypothetical protein